MRLFIYLYVGYALKAEILPENREEKENLWSLKSVHTLGWNQYFDLTEGCGVSMNYAIAYIFLLIGLCLLLWYTFQVSKARSTNCFDKSFKWHIVYQNCIVSEESSLFLSKLPAYIYSVDALIHLLNVIDNAKVCHGSCKRRVCTTSTQRIFFKISLVSLIINEFPNAVKEHLQITSRNLLCWLYICTEG